VVEQPLTAAEKGGHDRQVQLIDQAGPEVLLDRGGPASEPDVVAVGGLERSLERRIDAVVDEVERGSALHRDGRTGVVGEHEHRVVEGRVVAPPAGPPVAAPGPADRAEHVAAHDRGADAYVGPGGELVVDALVAALPAVRPAKAAGGQGPFVQSTAAGAQRVVGALVRAGAAAVERDREVVHA
jgi:hypothetical protein